MSQIRSGLTVAWLTEPKQIGFTHDASSWPQTTPLENGINATDLVPCPNDKNTPSLVHVVYFHRSSSKIRFYGVIHHHLSVVDIHWESRHACTRWKSIFTDSSKHCADGHQLRRQVIARRIGTSSTELYECQSKSQYLSVILASSHSLITSENDLYLWATLSSCPSWIMEEQNFWCLSFLWFDCYSREHLRQCIVLSATIYLLLSWWIHKLFNFFTRFESLVKPLLT